MALIGSGLTEFLDKAEELLSQKAVSEAVEVLNRIGRY